MLVAGTKSVANLSNRRGVAALELVIILPVLITIVLGCVDFGRFAYTHIAVTNGARAGADFASSNRYTAVSQTTWLTNVRQAVLDEMSQMPGFNSADLSVPTPVVTTENTGLKRLSVQVNYPFKTIVTWPGIPSQMALTRTVQMRCIRW